jgi:hypothetical protein
MSPINVKCGVDKMRELGLGESFEDCFYYAMPSYILTEEAFSQSPNDICERKQLSQQSAD